MGARSRDERMSGLGGRVHVTSAKLLGIFDTPRQCQIHAISLPLVRLPWAQTSYVHALLARRPTANP